MEASVSQTVIAVLPDQSVRVGGGQAGPHGGGVRQLVAVVGHHVSRTCLPRVTGQGVQVTRVHRARVKHDVVILLGAALAVHAAILDPLPAEDADHRGQGQEEEGAKEDYNIMFDPSTMDTCHLHTLARDTRETRAGHVVPNYSHQLPHSATMGHGLATPHSYRLVRQHSNDGLTDRGFHHVAAGPGGRGWGVALSSPSSPVHSALQPAYSSPRVYE